MTDQLPSLQLALSAGSIEAYSQSVSQIPMLSREQELALAVDFQQNNNIDAARQLVLAHLRFVVKVAKGYSGYGLSQADLIQEGNVGLMKAVKSFDPNMGVRLVSFAVHWIKAEMHEFIIRNWRIVKIATTKAQRKLFFNLRKMKHRLGWFTQEEVEDVATELGVKPKEVLEMERRLNNYDDSFDGAGIESEEGSAQLPPAETLTQGNDSPFALLAADQTERLDSDRLQQALLKLDTRSQDIIRQRWLQEKKATLHDLAAKYDVSAERIRQLEAKAFAAIREIIVA